MRLTTIIPALLVSISIAFFAFPLIVSASAASNSYDRISSQCKTQSGSCTSGDVSLFNAATLACRNPSEIQCTAADRAFLQSIRANVESNSTGMRVESTSGTPAPASGKCTSWVTDFSFDACIGKPVLSWLASLFLMFGAFILRLVGMLFEALVQAVIVDFGGTLTAMKLGDAIATGWTIFRDFANILIIGMFVFIAISIILGIKEYGQKKLIANVLIVAMLLNFSLLFTRLVIDVSNYTAYQIYSAMAGTTSGTTNIAEGFLSSMGITSIWNDSGKVVDEMAKESNGGGTFKAFGFGLMGGVMLLTIALVLLYGCFIIAARGLLFVFLMLTAALAFATYLIPGMAQGEYGFSKWWKTLLNAAIFAPLLMIFLAISYVIVSKASSAASLVGGGSGPAPLGTIVADPRSLTVSGGWITILLFALGTGLLFISIRLSSKFAGSISGMGYVPGLFRNLAAAPIALTAGRVMAPLMQRTLGARALGKAGALQGAARAANFDAGLAASAADRYASQAARLARAGDTTGAFAASQSAAAQRQLALNKQTEAQKLIEKSAKAKVKADKTYNIMDTGMAKAINKAVGNAILSGESAKGAKGYASQVEDKAKHAAQLAEGVKPGDAERQRARDEAEKNANMKHAQEFQDLRTRRETAERDRQAAELRKQTAEEEQKTAKSRAEQDKQNAEYIASAAAAAQAKTEKERNERTHNDEIGRLNEQLRNATTPAERQELMQEMAAREKVRDVDLKDYDARIAKAEREHLERTQRIDKTLADAAQKLATASSEMATAGSNITAIDNARARLEQVVKNEVDTTTKNYTTAGNRAAEEVAAGIGRHEAGVGFQVNSDHVADAARSTFRKKQGNTQRLKDLLRDEDIAGGDNGGAGAAEGGTQTT